MFRYMALLVMLLIIGVAAQSGYSPLTRSDRRAFVRAAEAVRVAADEGNYVGVMRFGPGILAKYESILLDPGSRDLRDLYNGVDSIIGRFAVVEKIDTFEIGIRRLIDGSNYLGALQRYDDYLDYLVSLKISDSLIGVHRDRYRDCMLRHYDGEFGTLKGFSDLRHADKNVLDSLKNNVEGEKLYRDLFVQVSSSNNLGDLLEFRARYPGLYEDDINNMIASYRARWRLGIKRRPNIERIEEYYAVFPEHDRMIDSVHQQLLYKEFKGDMTVLTAMKYLTNFPNGIFARELRTFIDIQQEQQRMEQLQMLYGIQAQAAVAEPEPEPVVPAAGQPQSPVSEPWRYYRRLLE